MRIFRDRKDWNAHLVFDRLDFPFMKGVSNECWTNNPTPLLFTKQHYQEESLLKLTILQYITSSFKYKTEIEARGKPLRIGNSSMVYNDLFNGREVPYNGENTEH